MTSVAGHHAQNDRGYEADNDLPAPALAPGHSPVPTSSLMQINATIPIAVGGASPLAFDSRSYANHGARKSSRTASCSPVPEQFST